MAHDDDGTSGRTPIPEEQLRNNAFAVTPEPLFWPHVSLDWNADRAQYELVVYSDDPFNDGTELLRMDLVTLVVAEAEFSFDERRQLVAESNEELRQKAAALRSIADRLIQRHLRPELVGGRERQRTTEE